MTNFLPQHQQFCRMLEPHYARGHSLVPCNFLLLGCHISSRLYSKWKPVEICNCAKGLNSVGSGGLTWFCPSTKLSLCPATCLHCRVLSLYFRKKWFSSIKFLKMFQFESCNSTTSFFSRFFKTFHYTVLFW